MNENEAKELVANTLGAAFNRDAFARLLVNVLTAFNAEKRGTFAGKYLPKVYKNFVSRYDRIGQYVGPDDKTTDLLVVRLKRGGSAFRARAAQRAFVANYLKQRGGKDAALVAFHFPDEAAWRFSLVRMEYRIRKTRTGTLAAEAKLSAVRRLSFLVGGKNTRTAQDQLAELIVREQAPTLAELESAFSVMPVTREFFESYRRLYERVLAEVNKALRNSEDAKADFKEKKISPADFAKKLLGQIVFLHFLQRKGWLGVPMEGKWGDGPHNFLRERFDIARQNKIPFYAKILQPLFYDALRNDSEDGFYAPMESRIPFLNGGLFEPLNGHSWGKAGLSLPDGLFSNQNKTPEGDQGDGILDVFARYNFTVAEDEPAEREVAVDPEMLGKVFENLIEDDARKAQGAYYTPREIVQFMCRESLRRHLTDESARRKLSASASELDEFIEAADLARETEELLGGDNPKNKKNKTPLPAKVRKCAAELDKILCEIRVCDPAVGSGAFVVGMMHEIVRLRAALAPALGAREADTYQMKRNAIRESLYGVDKDGGAVDIAQLRLWLSMVVDEEDPDKIEPLPNLDYKIVPGDSLASIRDVFNNEKFWKLEELQDEFFDETQRSRKNKLRSKIETIVDGLTGQHPELDPAVHFSRVHRKHGGFDIVIGNPPYDELDNTRDAEKRQYVEKLRNLYQYSVRGKINLYRVFIERGFQLTRKGGVLSLIVPNTLLADRYAAGVRQMMANNGALRFLIEFPESAHVFEVVTQATAIFLVNREKSRDFFDLSIKVQTPDLPPPSPIKVNWDSIRQIDGVELTIPLLREKAEVALIKKIHKNTSRLSDIAHIGKGDARLGKNGDKEISDFPCSHILVRGEHIQRYAVDLSDENQDRRWVDFPALVRNAKARRAIDVSYRVARERVVCQNVANMDQSRRIIASLIKKGTVTADSTNYIYPHIGVKWSVRALLAVLSSRLLNWRFKKTSSNNHVNVYELERLPLPSKVPEKKMERLSELAEEILKARRAGLDLESIQRAESEIDSLVYGLFGLTDREIALVERE